jgi:hypothetical protein
VRAGARAAARPTPARPAPRAGRARGRWAPHSVRPVRGGGAWGGEEALAGEATARGRIGARGSACGGPPYPGAPRPARRPRPWPLGAAICEHGLRSWGAGRGGGGSRRSARAWPKGGGAGARAAARPTPARPAPRAGRASGHWAPHSVRPVRGGWAWGGEEALAGAAPALGRRGGARERAAPLRAPPRAPAALPRPLGAAIGEAGSGRRGAGRSGGGSRRRARAGPDWGAAARAPGGACGRDPHALFVTIAMNLIFALHPAAFTLALGRLCLADVPQGAACLF